MKWSKCGLIYNLTNTDRHPKLFSHTANPLPILIEDDIYRIFFYSRDKSNRSSIGAVDIDIVTCNVIQEHNNPFFEYGPKRSFYADGVSLGNCYEVRDVQYMLFMGWQRLKGGLWCGDIGRFIVRSDLTLELDSEEALMRTDIIDPITLSYPCVLKNKSGDYSMWYGTTITRDAGNGEMLHVINHATSIDGDNWVREGLAVPYELGRAQVFSRPAVVRNLDGSYSMWFSYRGQKNENYRIGYAVSKDGRKWELCIEEAGIDVSTKGWDSEMIGSPSIFDHKGHRYMLYTGNDYGKTGFGLAVLQS